MKYIVFSMLFTLIHTISYTLAGMIALKVSKDLYEDKQRVIDYLRDMSVKEESKHVEKWFIPAQLVRGILMSVVLYPILGVLGEIAFVIRALFLGGLMFIYTDLACAVPFPHNIEGLVYMKPRYIRGNASIKLFLEMFIYSVIFGLAAGWFLF
ncbi:hypothetical protein [Gudongella sp. SC589]|uniref:hypothetical protein n=1 Tax=Gudongella sp. SC589 TaxID=3385990 RepID=UPI0039046D69